ncbi:hypothetical protein [Nonomuraea sp. NPDC049309]|uniref:hypothetical protein n=1 Tax=Nonomuraea sp. NPDC049309 TaxID=3364350 RepID=UPI0037246533
MSFQKIRSTIAVAAVAAGVSWLCAGPAAARTCARAEPAALPLTQCGHHTGIELDDPGIGASRVITTETNRLAMAAGETARRLGLTGLATGRRALGMSDLGGIAATWGMPSLAGSPTLLPLVPQPLTMKDLATMRSVPALPELPRVPLAGKPPAGRQGEGTLGESKHSANRQDRKAPPPPTVAGTRLDSPIKLHEPVREVGSQVISELLPKAFESLEGTRFAPGGGSIISGFSSLGGLTQALPLPLG